MMEKDDDIIPINDIISKIPNDYKKQDKIIGFDKNRLKCFKNFIGLSFTTNDEILNTINLNKDNINLKAIYKDKYLTDNMYVFFNYWVINSKTNELYLPRQEFDLYHGDPEIFTIDHLNSDRCVIDIEDLIPIYSKGRLVYKRDIHGNLNEYEIVGINVKIYGRCVDERDEDSILIHYDDYNRLDLYDIYADGNEILRIDVDYDLREIDYRDDRDDQGRWDLDD